MSPSIPSPPDPGRFLSIVSPATSSPGLFEGSDGFGHRNAARPPFGHVVGGTVSVGLVDGDTLGLVEGDVLGLVSTGGVVGGVVDVIVGGCT